MRKAFSWPNGVLRWLLPVVTILVFSSPVRAIDATRIMPLGDSITRGGYGAMHYSGYRKPLYDLLTNGGYSFDFVGSATDGNFPDPNHEGHDSWRADQVLTSIGGWLNTYQPDVVLLHIGTNDITLGNQDANEIKAILNEVDVYEATNNKVVTVIVALIINRIPYSSVTTEYNNDVEVMASNRIAGGDNIIIVDMESALNYSTDMADGIHPNNGGYAKMAAVWNSVLVGDSKDSLEEINQRLELRTNGWPLGSPVYYVANGWSLDVAEDFAVRVDYHYSGINAADGWIGMNVGDDANYVSISAGSDGNQPYFYYEAAVDGNGACGQEPRTSNDGTLYVSFDSILKKFYLSHTGFGSKNAYVWTAPNQWGQPVNISVGGGSSGGALGPGEAYIYDFEIAGASIINWPPATDLDKNGYIEIYDLAAMCENWLENGPGDIDNSGYVDFVDIAELGLAW